MGKYGKLREIEKGQDMLPNPFTPTFGSVPAELAGRRQLIADILEGLDNAPGDPNRASIFVGPRGSGKTVLLTAIAEQAQSRGWISVNVTSGIGMLAEIMVQARDKGDHVLEPETLSRLTGLQIGDFGFTRELGERQSTWRSELTGVVQQLNDSGVGLLITVDEASAGADELRMLVDTFQHFVREKRNVALLLAGLPHNVSVLLGDDTVSFLRRAFRHSMQAIGTNDVADAMRETIEGAGRSISPEALDIAASGAGGFAFLIQLIGYHLWRVHPSEHEIAPDDARIAIDYARRDMEQMVFEPTVRDLSRRELEFLQAMTCDAGTSNVRDIAERMGIDPNNASKVKRRLTERGLVGTRGRGRVGFDMPMLREYVEAF